VELQHSQVQLGDENVFIVPRVPDQRTPEEVFGPVGILARLGARKVGTFSAYLVRYDADIFSQPEFSDAIRLNV
jgi:hypothetical protein